MRKLTQFLRLHPAERRILIQSVLLLPLVAVLLRTIGLARSWALLRRAAGGSSPVPVVRGLKAALGADAIRHEWRRPGVFEDASPQSPDTVRMVEVAAHQLPWQPTCLPRSLVLWFLLRRQGVPAELRIGVQKSHERLTAHAWVEVDRRVVNDSPDIAAEYRPFDSIAAALRSPASSY